MALFYVLASSSSGNCCFYMDGRARILIDAGISTRAISGKLKEISLAAGSITHILITHAHTDHTSALPVLLKHTGAEVICSEGTYNELTCEVPNVSLIEPGECFELNGCPVCSFKTPHDGAGSCGFVLGQGEKSVAVCTDLGPMNAEVYKSLKKAKTVMLESNHDIAMLKDGPYPYFLKKRILSDDGHLSNEACAQAVLGLYEGGAKRFILGHLSRTNNTPAHALTQTRDVLESTGELGFELTVASQYGLAPVMV